MCQFCHLHLHTEYSLLDGVTKIDNLLSKLKDHGMDSCAITDHGVMYGAFEFWNKSKEYGIKPILGCEVYVSIGSRFKKETTDSGKRYYHLTLLAKNKVGYHNLVRLVSRGFKEGFYYKPRVDKELLSLYSEGLICLTGCPGSPVNQALLANKPDEAEDWVNFLGNEYDDLYFELMRSDIPELSGLEAKQLELNKQFELPYVATVDSHYVEPDDWKIQEIAWCIADGKQIQDPKRRQYGSREFYIKGEEEMKELFSDIPEAVSNTKQIADKVEKYDITFDRIQPQYYNIPKDTDSFTVLKEEAFEGAKKRYGEVTKEIEERLNYELEIIDQKGYNDYFLVVQDYCNWAREQGIMVGPGRGSGAGSVVAYALGIVNIDPLRWDLIFERFLNPERNSPPDFDIDFQDDRRDELFKYMSKTYGDDKTSFIGTFGRLKTKAAIRDVARVMGIDLSIADKLSKMVIVKFGRVHTIDRMMEEVPEFKQIIDSSPELQELSEHVRKLENISRHVSIHACGYLVTPKSIIDYVPVQKETKGGEKIVTQIEGWVVEYMGLMKFDFLGLSNLTIIQNTLKLIEQNTNEVIDIDSISLEDDTTFELFRQGNTTGVFQFESDGMKKYLRDLAPTNLEDLIFMNAAYRPGPMQYIPDYIKRKKGEQEVTYLHPDLKPILESTFGFAIYQEQVMRIAVDFAGYSLGQADMLRRAMGKKKPEVMAAEKENFVKLAHEKGHSKELAEEVFAYLEPFADYGFNRSHSACYSLIAYQTAYLKANYPLEFLAGIMQTDLGNADKISRDLIEAREMGVEVKPPDINFSLTDFTIEDSRSIRFGLSAIKGGSSKVMENIVQERIASGKFTSLDDIIRRVGTKKITKKDLEQLTKVGALDRFGTRNQILNAIPAIFDKIQKDEKNAQGGQTGLFGLLEEGGMSIANEVTPLPSVPKEDNQQRLIWERELLGTFLSEHPLDKHAKALLHSAIFSINSLLKHQPTGNNQLLCMITNKKVIYTKKSGKPMAFLALEDMTSKLDGIVFPNSYNRLIDQVVENTPIIITGTINDREGEKSIIVEDIQQIKDIPTKSSIAISIIGESNQDRLTELKDLIAKNKGTVELKIIYGSQTKRHQLVTKIKPTPRLVEVIKRYQIE
ncbi:DNA polymerase III subunit alpha [Candidatus Dojkabacteria bacterium]|uniref:DNA polymerase III subunit alpha n=1 Tax=Candidatus Dojkabacteria bacterium TaxID=2099670 RepID=A0A955L7B9_9BACT|nr:DNA polymerase III subunit alpha [Candidatus Dojkabacteria bacterium]